MAVNSQISMEVDDDKFVQKHGKRKRDDDNETIGNSHCLNSPRTLSQKSPEVRGSQLDFHLAKDDFSCLSLESVESKEDVSDGDTEITSPNSSPPANISDEEEVRTSELLALAQERLYRLGGNVREPAAGHLYTSESQLFGFSQNLHNLSEVKMMSGKVPIAYENLDPFGNEFAKINPSNKIALVDFTSSPTDYPGFFTTKFCDVGKQDFNLQEDSKLFKCNQCSFCCSNVNSFYEHKAKHSSQKPLY